MSRLLLGLYFFIDALTFIYLTFLDGYIYNAWNWVIAIPVIFFYHSFGQFIGLFCIGFLNYLFTISIIFLGDKPCLWHLHIDQQKNQ